MLATKGVMCANPVSYEENIMAKAQKDHKEIVGLEEPAEQIALLDNIPIDSVVKDLMDELNGKQDDNGDYEKMVRAYKSQDLPALYVLLKKSDGLGTDIGAFLDERNKKWIDRMVDKMEQKSVFFAVGAGHLWGNNGIITLLRKAGYTAEPIK